MLKNVYVTGIGIISSIGNNVEETFGSLRSMRSGIGPITLLKTVHGETYRAAEIKLRNEELFARAGMAPKKGLTRTALLGIIAAQEAAAHARIDTASGSRIGLISGTSVGGMDTTENVYFNLVNGTSDLIAATTHDCADSTEKIAERLNVRGHISTISTACSASANSIMTGMKMIQHGLLDAAIVGGVDSLTRFTLNGFHSLKILSADCCKPFDENRDGITLGEGAAYLVIESEDAVRSGNKKVLCQLAGYGNACDAFHQTATSPDGDGPYLAMSKALEKAGLTCSDFDYINAHGTGTVNNDLSESKAIERVFSGTPPPMSSTKGYTGHCLGASGGIEAVISVLSILHQTVFPNVNFAQQMKETSFAPASEVLGNVRVKHVLSNSFGFGGNNTTLIFSGC